MRRDRSRAAGAVAKPQHPQNCKRGLGRHAPGARRLRLAVAWDLLGDPATACDGREQLLLAEFLA